MGIINDLVKLYNTLMLINTNGEDTKRMSNCLQYLEGMIAREQEQAKVTQQNETKDGLESTEE